MNLKGIQIYEFVAWVHLAEDTVQWQTLYNTVIETLNSLKDGNFYELSDYLFFRKYFATWS
jgi:hypothetical protein